MRNLKRIQPKNLTAQLDYLGIGNPPSSHPSTAVSNSFPGLEMDFRNVWKHILEGIVLLEYSNLVIGVDDSADKKFRQLVDRGLHYELISVDGKSVVGNLSGPSSRPNETIRGTVALEWSNALAETILKAGEFVTCRFRSNRRGRKIVRMKLKVRHFFDVDTDVSGKILRKRVVISRELAAPGDLTQSLCSPWQNDYRECGCFYWAASRPDYVNVEPEKNGVSMGNNWMEKNRNNKTNKAYIVDDFQDARLISYTELFTGWEKALRFIIEGKDEVLKKKSRKKFK
jgi:hypothetical protein